jgi:hypothetical protein
MHDLEAMTYMRLLSQRLKQMLDGANRSESMIQWTSDVEEIYNKQLKRRSLGSGRRVSRRCFFFF